MKMRSFLIRTLAFAVLIFSTTAFGEEAKLVKTVDRPGFRTDLGIYLGAGGHTCIGGGSNYASCSDTQNAWDTGWGIAGGVVTRPLSFLSIGIDLGYNRMIYHQQTKDKWGDLLVGPVFKFHLPFSFAGMIWEPNLGIQAGYVQGTYYQKKRGSDEVDYKHKHTGAFLTLLAGMDLFFMPRFGVGLEARFIRTFYQEVCYEWYNGVSCRGIDDTRIVNAYKEVKEQTGESFPGEKGISDFPWKLFYGTHVLYYF